jgi:hypothetical protein
MTSYPPPPPPGDPQDQPPGGYYPPQGQAGHYPPPGEQGGYYPPQGQAGYYQQPQKRGSGMAIAALILGIIALLSCWTIVGGILFGLIAIVLGFVASRRAKRGEAGGRGMAITGIVLGLLGLVLSVVIVAVIGAFWNSASFSDYRECLNDAGSDQQAIADCETEFREVIEDQASN